MRGSGGGKERQRKWEGEADGVDRRGKGRGQVRQRGGQDRQRKWTEEAEEVDRRGRGSGQER